MSATLVGTIRGLFAIGNVTAQVGPVYTAMRGFVSPPLRNGAGDYTLTLQDGLTLNTDGGGTAKVQAYGATPACTSVEQVDATHLRVRTTDAAGAALEANFGIEIQDVGPQ
jgi:hypothetical protein